MEHQDRAHFHLPFVGENEVYIVDQPFHPRALLSFVVEIRQQIYQMLQES